jgi:hypothetical protein
MAEYRNFQLDSPQWSPRDLVAFGAISAWALVVGCLLLNLTVTRPFWRPDLGILDDKFRALAAQKDEVDLVFLGTSRINQGIDPEAFDAAARNAGAPVHSFNLGVEDMKCQEYWMCLDEISRMPLPRLKWVVVEPTQNLTLSPSHYLTARSRYLSRWETVPPAVRSKWSAQRPLLRRAQAVASIIAAWGTHAANLGVLSDLHLPALPEKAGAQSPRIVRGGPAEQTTIEEDRERVDRYAARRSRAASRRPVLPDLPAIVPADEVRIQEILFSRIRRIGARPVILFPPQIVKLDLMRASEAAARRAGPDLPHREYYPGAGPEWLYENSAYWRDSGHLSLEGARVFSSKLATDLVPVLRGE